MGGQRAVKPTAAYLHEDAFREIFSRLEDVKDKLSFAATCKTARTVSQDGSCWQTCNVGEHGAPRHF